MTNDKKRYYFTIEITEEQLKYSNNIVNYSLKHHHIDDIFSKDPDGKTRQKEFRFTGTLGEVVFADTYGLKRPTRSFGAIDGQDYGQDFLLDCFRFDIKTMRRKDNKLKPNYVLNIPEYQVLNSIKTDYYYNISISKQNNKYYASFVGFVSKNSLIGGNIGILYGENTIRQRENNTNFKFLRGTYEVLLSEMINPIITGNVKKLKGYELIKLND